MQYIPFCQGLGNSTHALAASVSQLQAPESLPGRSQLWVPAMVAAATWFLDQDHNRLIRFALPGLQTSWVTR